MRARYLALAPILALALLPNVPADATSTPTCFGFKADYVGTNKADKVTLGGNLKVVVLKGGNDVVTVDGFGGVVCAGDGDDVVTGPIGFISGGSGKDRLVWHVGCDAQPNDWFSSKISDVERTVLERCPRLAE